MDAAVVEQLDAAGVDRLLFMLPSAGAEEMERAADEAAAIAASHRT